MDAFDAVIVPDFSGKAALTFEARTLYFLASWIELSGVCGQIPVHVASIGEPPPSVRALAKRCGAIVSIHEPMTKLGIYANKLRGFEVPRETKRLLLLDADIVVLGNLGELAREVPANAIAAGPSHSAIIFPEMWRTLYERLGVPTPAPRMPDFHKTLDMAERPDSLYPSFNSGVVLAPYASPLREVWLEHLAVLAEYRPEWTKVLKPHDMLVGDEPALATAIHALAARGEPIHTLADRYNARWRHLYRRAPTFDEAVIFHMTSSFGHGAALLEKLDPRDRAWQTKLLRRFGKRWLEYSRSPREAVKNLLPASLELRRWRPLFERLHDKHIRPVIS